MQKMMRKDDEEKNAEINYDPTMPHMADGGIAGDFDVNTGDSDTVKGMPLSDIPAPPIATPPIAKEPQIIPPAAAPVSKPMPGIPPSVTPDMLQQLLSKQRGELNKYSPDRQFNTEQAMVKARSGLPMGLAHAGATFADAIMQGVARAGNPGFAKQIDENNQNVFEQSAGSLERGRKGTMEQIEADNKLNDQDPNSAKSRSLQKAALPIFSKMGYRPEQIAAMPASHIMALTELGIKHEEGETSNALKQLMAEIQMMTAKGNQANQSAERKEKALGDLSKMGVIARNVTQRPIAKELEKAAGIGETGKNFANESEAAAAGLPDGTKVTIGGKTGTWRHK